MKALLWLVLTAAPAAAAQSAVATYRPPGAPPTRVRALTFNITKPVLGLPSEQSKAFGLCSTDGLSYFNVASATTSSSDQSAIYRVSTTGEVQTLRRSRPLDFTSWSIRDFYPADHTLVTLLEAEKRDDRDPDAKPRETAWFLSLMDHDGDHPDLIRLDLHFKPLRVAAFDSGNFLMLGWEEANGLPLLAILKPDGTVQRFVDAEEWKDRTSTRKLGPSTFAGLTLDELQRVHFVPFRGNVLLTFPGTAKPVRFVIPSGQSWPIPIDIPGGYVLHDVLVTSGSSTFVARVQAGEDLIRQLGSTPPPRIFEFSAFSGDRITEFTFDKLNPYAVSCAAKSSLTAIFLEEVGDAPKTDSGAQAADKPVQLVIGTVLR